MAVNDTIREVDYNAIRNKVVTVLGTGSADYGYGQAVKSSAVVVGQSVTVNEWANLYYDIVNCYVHQTGAAPTSPTSANLGATVRYNATNSPNAQFDTFADTLTANRFTVAGSQSFTLNRGTTSQTWPGLYGTYWNSKIQCLVTVTFPSSSAARYFFNSGGEIRISSSLTGSTANAQTIAWSSLLSSAGTKTFGGNKPNTGTEPNDNTNFYRLTDVFSLWASSSASGPYTANRWQISAKSNVVDNSTGTSQTVTFLVEWLDGYTDPGPEPSPPPGDEVYGTMNLSVTTLEPTGILVPAGSGNFSVTSPTVTLGAITT